MFHTKIISEESAMPLRLTLTGLASQYIHMPLAPFCLKKAVDDSGLDIRTTICDLNINEPFEDSLASFQVLLLPTD